jgi:putative nucleotidyltransferase with HDIG domain
MSDTLPPCPAPPAFDVPWASIDQDCPWLADLRGCPQDPIHHAEGDVWLHTRMVCEELAALPAWRALGEEDRRVLFAAALLHDVAKPECTRTEPDGRITSRGHSRRGAVVTRQLLWRRAVPFALRERVCGLIRYHQVPYFLIDRPDASRVAVEVSQTTRCDHLAVLAEADVRGRICTDRQRLLDNVALFAEQCREEGCLTAPRPFASDHARFLYFRDPSRHPDAPAHAAFKAEAVLLSGLPGTGKDHHARQHFADHEIVSLDELRDELDAEPTGDQGAVLTAARALARDHLRAGRSFVWNATNLSRQLRGGLIGLFAAYGARVRIVYLEVPEAVLTAQNRQRAAVVPEKAMCRILDRWEVPDRTEAHRVDWLVRAC